MKAFLLFLKDHVSIVVIVILSGIIIFLRECKKPCPEARTITKIDTVFHTDTIYSDRIIPIPQVVYVDTTHSEYVPPTDTLAIVKKYFAQNTYRRTLVNDTNAVIILTDTVWKNQLLEGKLSAKFFDHTKTITITKETVIQQKLRNKVFVGFQLGVNMKDSRLITAPQLYLLTKKDHLYGLGYDLMSKAPSVNMAWKIRLSKK